MIRAGKFALIAALFETNDRSPVPAHIRKRLDFAALASDDDCGFIGNIQDDVVTCFCQL
jgi:hypothetical protein